MTNTEYASTKVHIHPREDKQTRSPVNLVSDQKMMLSATDNKKTGNYAFYFVAASLVGLLAWSMHDIWTLAAFSPKELDGTPMMDEKMETWRDVMASVTKRSDVRRGKKMCTCKRMKASYAGVCYMMTGKQAANAEVDAMFDCDTRQCVAEYECVDGYDTGMRCTKRRVAVGVQPIGYGKCVQMKRYEDIYVPVMST